MRYLLDLAKFTLGSDFHYRLDMGENIKRPTECILRNFCFICSQVTHPTVILMRSNLHEYSDVPNIVELSSENQRHTSDVLAVLYESISTGRYELKREVKFQINPHKSIRSLEIWFTNAEGVVQTQAISGGGGGGGSSLTLTEQMEALTNLLLWVDYGSTTTLTGAFAPTNGTPGENFKYIYNRSPANSNLIFMAQDSTNANYEFEFAVFGAGLGMMYLDGVNQ